MRWRYDCCRYESSVQEGAEDVRSDGVRCVRLDWKGAAWHVSTTVDKPHVENRNRKVTISVRGESTCTNDFQSDE